jgi:hypothetical protein
MSQATLQPVFRARGILRPLLLLVLVAIVGLCAGCATRPQLVEIRVPVPIECRVDKPARPAMPTDALQPSDSIDRKVKALLAENELREGYEILLVAALELCTKPLDPAAKLP